MVSVIVPIFNAEKFLQHCLDSIISQTYQELEIILINDGSTDSSGDICDEYALKDKRIKVIHQTNGGVCLARYNAVQVATGEWAFFVDADDEIMPNSVEVLLSSSSDKVDIISGSMIIHHVLNHQTKALPSHIKEIGFFSREQFIKNQILGSRLPGLWRQLIKMDVLKRSINILPSEVIIGEDFLTNIMIGLNINQVKGIANVVYQYNIHDTNTTILNKQTIEYQDLLDSILTQILSGYDEFNEVLFRYRMTIIESYIQHKGINHSTIVKKALSDSKYFKKNVKDRLLLFLCKLNNNTVRNSIWKLVMEIRNSFIFSHIHHILPKQA